MVEPFVYPHGDKYPRSLDGERMPDGLEPGIYLVLWNGINEGDDRFELDDCGFGGPVIGPLDSVNVTYATEVKLIFIDFKVPPLYIANDVSTCADMLILHFYDDELVFDGCLYGDWMVTYVS